MRISPQRNQPRYRRDIRGRFKAPHYKQQALSGGKHPQAVCFPDWVPVDVDLQGCKARPSRKRVGLGSDVGSALLYMLLPLRNALRSVQENAERKPPCGVHFKESGYFRDGDKSRWLGAFGSFLHGRLSNVYILICAILFIITTFIEFYLVLF